MPEYQIGGGACKVRREEADARRSAIRAQQDAALRRRDDVQRLLTMLRAQRGEAELAKCSSADPIRPALEALASEYQPQKGNPE